MLQFAFYYLLIAFIRCVLSTSLQFRSKENNGLRPAVFYVSLLFMKLLNRKNKQNNFDITVFEKTNKTG